MDGATAARRQSRDQTRQGAFPGTAGTHQRHPHPGSNGDTQVINQGGAHGGEAVGQILNVNLTGKLLAVSGPRGKGWRSHGQKQGIQWVVQHVLEAEDRRLDLRQGHHKSHQSIHLRLQPRRHLLSRQQHPQGEPSIQHQQKPHEQHPQRVELIQQIRQQAEGRLSQGEAMLKSLHLALMAIKPPQHIRLDGGALHHVDLKQRRHQGAFRLTRVLLQLQRGIPLLPQADRHHQGIQCRGRRHHQSQKGAVGQGEQQIQHQQQQAAQQRKQAQGDEIRHLTVEHLPLTDVSRVALAKEVVRQGQHMALKGERPAGLQPPAEVTVAQELELSTDGLQQNRQSHGPEHGLQPLPQRRSPDIVDVDLGEHRHRQLRQDQEQSRQQAEQRWSPLLPEAGEQQQPGIGHPPATAKGRPGPKLQHHPSESSVERLLAHPTGTRGRIIEGHPLAAEALQHNEMIELPKQNQWKLLLAQGRQIHAIALAFQPIEPSRPQQAGSVTAITGDATHLAQFQQGHHPSVSAQHNRQAGRSAFGGLHLQHGWGANSGHHQ